jgi:ribosome biogenesis GTPase
MAKKKKSVSNTPIELQKGVVVRSTGAQCHVRTPEGEIFVCSMRGKFRIDEKIRSTNPVAIGDEVAFLIPEQKEQGELAMIHTIHKRRNYLLRKSITYPNKVHILCANIDQAVIIFTLKSPRTTTGFVNRFLVTAEAYHIPSILIINKIDLLETEEEMATLADITKCYEQAGYQVIPISALNENDIEKVKSLFEGKISFISGHSGVGKSTLLNQLDPNLDLRTSEISDYNDKGTHTTTFSEMYPIGNGYVIDSPGIKEMGIVDFSKTELSAAFPEIRKRSDNCKFSDCRHHNEPHCAVKAAVEAGEIHSSRYKSYLRMLLDDLEA